MARGYGSGLAVILALASGGSLHLIGLAAAAFVRRQSRAYLFVLLSLGTFLVRTIVGAMMMTEIVASDPHHVVEHALALALVGVLLTAIGIPDDQTTLSFTNPL